ncbi:MAG: hypothetical protein KGL38_04090 [Gemmatimonadota bacterium]|nr:hypothetical protein [Gemmatimonadota bacterium]MDE3127160.1 hypothetical protein [Gemmatimonadota bacterium]MDE3171557.1 hypothetical protein [Gemmatimonadota bacterium]MDE3216024.1 hypothetical protein [Gemmatimonadota bacterium]
MPDEPLQSRRMMMTAAKRLLAVRKDDPRRDPADDIPRLTLSALEKIRMSRSRDRILSNLDDMYREAFERAKSSDDSQQMATLDFAYRREQLYLEILLDIRDAMERR